MIGRVDFSGVRFPPRTGFRSAGILLCAVSFLTLPAFAPAQRPSSIGLRHPESARLNVGVNSTRRDSCASDRASMIDTQVAEGRPVVASFEQATSDAQPMRLPDGPDVLPVGHGPNSPHLGQAGPMKPEVPFLRPGESGWGLNGFGYQGKPRHKGIGQPLLRSSWLYRPLSVSSFAGVMNGSPLITNWVGQKTGYFGGYRFGWDFDHYWGCELRYGFGTIPLWDGQRARAASNLASRDHPHDTSIVIGDIDLLYYPWGDARWRPYFMVGLGAAGLRFMDLVGNKYKRTAFATPLAFGLKYRCNPRLTLRFDLADNIIFGDGHGFGVLHNLSINGGVEIRYGGTRTAYWPYNPSRHYW